MNATRSAAPPHRPACTYSGLAPTRASTSARSAGVRARVQCFASAPAASAAGRRVTRPSTRVRESTGTSQSAPSSAAQRDAARSDSTNAAARPSPHIGGGPARPLLERPEPNRRPLSTLASPGSFAHAPTSPVSFAARPDFWIFFSAEASATNTSLPRLLLPRPNASSPSSDSFPSVHTSWTQWNRRQSPPKSSPGADATITGAEG